MIVFLVLFSYKEAAAKVYKADRSGKKNLFKTKTNIIFLNHCMLHNYKVHVVCAGPPPKGEAAELPHLVVDLMELSYGQGNVILHPLSAAQRST